MPQKTLPDKQVSVSVPENTQNPEYKEKKILLFVVLAYTYMFTEAGLVSFSLNFVFFEITKHH